MTQQQESIALGLSRIFFFLSCLTLLIVKMNMNVFFISKADIEKDRQGNDMK